MAEVTKPQGAVDPIEMWKQWSDTSTKMWTNLLNGGKEKYVDPYGLYRLWFKSINEAQEQFKPASMGMVDPKDVWKRWFETSTDIWGNLAQGGIDPVGLTTRWLEVMEATREKIMTTVPVPTDPFNFFKEWYDATSDTWSDAVGDLIGTDQFLEASSQFLERYTSFTMLMRRVNEEFFHGLQLPTRTDVARVAELVIALEDKVDKIEDEFEAFEEVYPRLATMEGVDSIMGRLNQLESKLSKLPAVLEKVDAVNGLEKRLDRVEHKLDTLLVALDRLATSELAHSNNAPRRKTSKASAGAKEGSGNGAEA